MPKKKNDDGHQTPPHMVSLFITRGLALIGACLKGLCSDHHKGLCCDVTRG